MASFARFLLIATSLAIMLFINPCAAKSRPLVTYADINTICSKTDDQSFCSRVLTNPSLHPYETNLYGLAKISINLALTAAYDTQQAISPLLNQAKNYKEREAYTLCSNNYKEASASVRNANRLLAKHDYRGVRVSALSGVEEAKDCESHAKINPNSPLVQKNGDFKNYCNILWVISNRLVEYY
ncbi:Pectinesterase inhibitor [Corchorus capsularis]|uniref:Pectinesterase inhibitor n=1 Tax=Corchorus capsularis TaxID=210143 RepID=A0A1R3JUT0_COCAP|nr:Pectinesterase inhibitor [Corchorus capsularis]